jgi:hypothetical protein
MISLQEISLSVHYDTSCTIPRPLPKCTINIKRPTMQDILHNLPTYLSNYIPSSCLLSLDSVFWVDGVATSGLECLVPHFRTPLRKHGKVKYVHPLSLICSLGVDFSYSLTSFRQQSMRSFRLNFYVLTENGTIPKWLVNNIITCMGDL